MTTMKAVHINAHGGPEVVAYGDVPRPEPGPNDVLVAVRAAALNHLDLWVRDGWPALKLHFPHVMGADGAGVVHSVGSNVTTLKPGDRVVINGTCLDYLAESFMAGDPLQEGGLAILNGVAFDAAGRLQELETPYPGGNLFSLASGGAIYLRDPHRQVSADQLNGGAFAPLAEADWALIEPYLKENERLFEIRVEDLLKVDRQSRRPGEVYRKVEVRESGVLKETMNR